MEALVNLLLVAMTAWVPPAQHAWVEPRSRTEARYWSIADDIAAVALDETEEPIDGDRVWTAVLLASIASFEGAFRADVDACQVGDNDDSWSLWQLRIKKRDACGSRRDAARAALRMAKASIEACRRVPGSDVLGVYTTGHCWRNLQARLRLRRAKNFMAQIVVTSGDRRALSQTLSRR